MPVNVPASPSCRSSNTSVITAGGITIPLIATAYTAASHRLVRRANTHEAIEPNNSTSTAAGTTIEALPKKARTTRPSVKARA